MRELIDSIDVKITQFLAKMQVIQRSKNLVFFYTFYSFGCLGSLAMLSLGRLDYWLRY